MILNYPVHMYQHHATTQQSDHRHVNGRWLTHRPVGYENVSWAGVAMVEGEVACCHHLNTQMGALRHGSTKVSRSLLWRETTLLPHFQVGVVMLHDGQGDGAHSLDTGHTWHLTHQYGRGLVFSSSMFPPHYNYYYHNYCY